MGMFTSRSYSHTSSSLLLDSGQARMLKALTAQRDKLRGRALELQAMLAFLDRKIAWLETGAKGPPPSHTAAPAAKR